MLARAERPVGVRTVDNVEKRYGAPRHPHGPVPGLVDRLEELAGDQMLVFEEVLRSVQHADRQAAPLAFVVDHRALLDQEEDLDEVLDVSEVLLAVDEIVVRRVLQIDGQILAVHPLHERVPWLRIAQDQREVDPPTVRALEDRRLRGHRLGMTAGLTLDQGAGIEPVGVGQLHRHCGGLLDGQIDEPTRAGLLALQQAEQHGLVSEAGRGVVRLVAAGSDRWDRVIVISRGDQQPAGGERYEVATTGTRPTAR